MPDIQDVKPFFRGRLCEVDQGNDILVTPFDCLCSGYRLFESGIVHHTIQLHISIELSAYRRHGRRGISRNQGRRTSGCRIISRKK